MQKENLEGFHLFNKGKSVLQAMTLPILKKKIKEVVEAPNDNKKIYIVTYSYDEKKTLPFKIIIGQYTLTPKLSVVSDDDDYSQTITYTKDELKKYPFKESDVGKIIKAYRENSLSLSSLSVPISDIL